MLWQRNPVLLDALEAKIIVKSNDPRLAYASQGLSLARLPLTPPPAHPWLWTPWVCCLPSTCAKWGSWVSHCPCLGPCGSELPWPCFRNRLRCDFQFSGSVRTHSLLRILANRPKSSPQVANRMKPVMKTKGRLKSRVIPVTYSTKTDIIVVKDALLGEQA